MTTYPNDWQKLVIKYQTPETLPPPYAYFLTLALARSAEELEVLLDFNYLNRDELDEESILEEGFSLDETFRWEGTLGCAWVQALDQQLKGSASKGTFGGRETDPYVEVQFDGREDGLFPTARGEWEYFLQEFLQAVYETSGRERPFEAEFVDLTQPNDLHLTLTAHFADRAFRIQLNGRKDVLLPWRTTRKVMETVFQADYLADEASEDDPKFSGKYLKMGDGMWYELGESVVEPTPDSTALHKIERLMEELAEKIA